MTDLGCIYVVEFGSGTVKVGRTVDPDQRMGHYERHAAIHGDVVVTHWVSPRHANHVGNELLLIRYCTVNGRVIAGREYFQGVSFGDVKDFAKSLTFDTEAHPAHHGEGLDFVRLFHEISAWSIARAAAMPSPVPSDEDLRGFATWRARREWLERKRGRRTFRQQERQYEALSRANGR